MDSQDDLGLGTAANAEDLQQGQSDATLLKQVPCCVFLWPVYLGLREGCCCCIESGVSRLPLMKKSHLSF